MPLGSFRLNGLAKYVAPVGSGDAPTIPSVTFDAGGVNTTTERSRNNPRSMVFLGVNNNLYHFAANGMSGTSSQRNRQVVSNFAGGTAFAQSIATGTTTQTYVSSSGVTVNGTAGGQYVSFMGSSTDVRYRTGYVANWNLGTTTNPGTVTGGTISAAIARSSSYSTPTVACAHSPLSTNTATHRPIFAYHTVVSSTNYITIGVGNQNSNSTTITFSISIGGAQIGSSATASYGNWVSACGFTSSSTTEQRYTVGYTGSASSYSVRATKIVSSSAYTTEVTPYSGSTVTKANVATAWNNLTDGKFVSVSCVNISNNTYLRALRITNWNTISTPPTVSQGTAYAHGSLLPNAQLVETGKNGLLFLVYTNSGFTLFYGRFVSVDSTTGAITVGSEISLGGTQNGGVYATFGCGGGLDASGKFCFGIQGSDAVASSSVSGWNVYRSSEAI